MGYQKADCNLMRAAMQSFVRVNSIFILLILLDSSAVCFSQNEIDHSPNIIYILADDLGFGDISILNSDSKIPTPNLDKLTGEGITFTDAHSGSAVCSPTRYGILTGRYAWRSRLQAGVLWTYEEPLIEKDRLTVPAYLQSKGYHTACIGKWHLGWEWPGKDGKPLEITGSELGWNIDFNRSIKNGPTTRGFDYYFGVDVPNFPPYCFIENDRTIGIPKIEKPTSMYGIPGIMLEGWSLEPILPELEKRAVQYIEKRAEVGQPFFLYLPLTAPHTPIAPAVDFRGASQAGAYGDFVYQIDHIIGKVMEVLAETGLDKNTLIIFTSDNGSPGRDGTNMEGETSSVNKYGHHPSYIYRGIKSDIWEGGHRVPFIARWPGKIQPGTKSDEIICLTDLFRTTAAILNEDLPVNSAEDSHNILPAMVGQVYEKPIREATVHHSVNGSFALRQGHWKLALCPGSGGWTLPPEIAMIDKKPMIQLYDLSRDIKEQNNLFAQYPDVANRMIRLLEKYVDEGRSTVGIPQQNDGNPDIWLPMRVRDAVYDTTVIKHLGVGKSVKIVNDAAMKYSKQGITILTDGIRGSSRYNDGNWVGIEENDVEMVLDLEIPQDLTSITLGVLESQNFWIFLPQQIDFSLSMNGQEFSQLKTFKINAPKENTENSIQDFKVKNIQTKSRYIKIKVKNVGTCPKWHKGAGGKAWLFMDEVIVK